MLKLQSLGIAISISLLSIPGAFAQSKYNTDLYKIYFEHDFEENTTGDYVAEEWMEDWNYPSWSDRQVSPEIISTQSDGSTSKYMRYHFPEGAVGPSEGGGQWLTKIEDGIEELYFSYNIRFKPGFDWVGGGKVPGLRGGPQLNTVGDPEWDAGFIALLMWKNPGSLGFYYYHQDKDHEYGDLVMWDHTLVTGNWYNVTIRLVLNTIDENGGQNNGILEGFINGKLVCQLDGIRFRNVDWTIDQLYVASFFGGSGDEYAAVKDEWIDVDEFVAYAYQPNVNIARGHQLNPPDIQLPIPGDPVSELQPPDAPDNLRCTQTELGKVDLQWNDNATNESGFEVWRYTAGQQSYTRIGTLNANATSYSDANVAYGIQYSYRIRAYNADGYSGYSNVLQITSLKPDPPKAPSSLTSKTCTDKSITISWDDNSNDEDGFVVVRQSTENPEDAVSISVQPNDTLYVDNDVKPSTTYIYTVQAVNDAGASQLSNRNIASTLSYAETKRVKEGLVAYYNFNFDPENMIRDFSGYGEALDLKMQNPNTVTWVRNKGISLLSSSTIASSLPAKKIVNAVKESNELTVECWIKPNETLQTGHSRIISLGTDNTNAGFVLDQDYAFDGNSVSIQYKVRMKTESTNDAGYPEFMPDNEASYLNIQHIVYVIDSLGREHLYINGEHSAESFRPGHLGNWKDNFYLRLGNENDGKYAWNGTFYTVAIYNKALTSDEIITNYESGPCDNLNKEGLEYQINAFPNPFRDLTTVKIMPDELHDYVPRTDIRVYDMYGKLHYQEEIINPNRQQIKTLDLSGLPKGIYFLRVLSGTKSSSTKLVVY